MAIFVKDYMMSPSVFLLFNLWYIYWKGTAWTRICPHLLQRWKMAKFVQTFFKVNRRLWGIQTSCSKVIRRNKDRWLLMLKIQSMEYWRQKHKNNAADAWLHCLSSQYFYSFTRSSYIHSDLPMTVPIVEVTPVLNKSIETLTIPANSARSKASTRELQGQPLGTTWWLFSDYWHSIPLPCRQHIWPTEAREAGQHLCCFRRIRLVGGPVGEWVDGWERRGGWGDPSSLPRLGKSGRGNHPLTLEPRQVVRMDCWRLS